MCYGNVLDKISADGGERVYGWQLALSPQRFIKALHHCVWRSPDGKLFDVTSAPFPRMGGTTATFIVDGSEPFPTDNFDPLVPSVFHFLTDVPIVKRFCIATRNRTERMRDFAAKVRAHDIQTVRQPEGLGIFDYKGHDAEFSRLNELLMHATGKKQRLEFELNQFPAQQGRDRCSCGSGKRYVYCHGS